MLDPLTIERALAKAGEGQLALGLSGGGDSTALLHLLVERFGASRVRAFVVDHALREGSCEDARCAQSFAASLGVECEILTVSWPDGPKPAQQAARRARYAVLCEAMRDAGARVLLLAHTADDQAETVLMRASAGSGWRGLAGMAAFAPAPVWPEGRDVMLARPLLGARREALRDGLRSRSAKWIEDPANANPGFERVRARRVLADAEAGGLDVMRLVRVAERLRVQARAVDSAARALVDRVVRFEGGQAVLDPSGWRGDEVVRRRALGALLTAASGQERAPEDEALGKLVSRLGGDFGGATLGGAVLARKSGQIRIGRDPGALLGRGADPRPVAPLAMPAGRDVVWDGRLLATAPEAGWEVAVSAAGAPVFAKQGAARNLDAAADFEPRWLLYSRTRQLLDAG